MKHAILDAYITDQKIKNRFRHLTIISGTVLAFCVIISISSCRHKVPNNINNICEIFSDKYRCQKYAKNSQNKWGTPIHVQMAILFQESGFKHDAKPDRKKVLGFIPWKRKSSAYGYAQVLTTTWNEYKKQTKNRGADRDSFKDAIDFVGWYTYETNKQIKVSKWDAYSQYLAYHEGRGGFTRKTYNSKKWLIDVAKKVDKNSRVYSAQLKTCQ